MKKNSTIFTGLFILMILAFTIEPELIYSFQDNLLGKSIILLILLYLTMNNVTLGLLFTLTIILILSRMDRPIIEGFKRKNIKKTQKKKKIQKLLKMKKKKAAKKVKKVKKVRKQIEDEDEDEDEDMQPQQLVNYNNIDFDEDDENGIDFIDLEETFRVRNPSTIPISREQFRVREVAPFDNINKYYGGMASLV